MYDAVADDYCYRGARVLKNKLDLADRGELRAFDAETSHVRAGQELPAGSLDFTHFKAVQGHLFQDVYDCAGKIRTFACQRVATCSSFPKTSRTEGIGCSRS